MVRTPGYDKSGLRKGTWTPEEDKKLTAYITKYGYWNWRQLPKYAGLARCGKSCRLRWMNYLRPNIKRGNYSKQEEDTIIRLHDELGNKWSVIAAHLPGRTDNEVKNYWHTYLKKRPKQNITGNETNRNGDFSQSISQESQTEGEVGEANDMDPQTNEIITCHNATSYSPTQSNIEFYDQMVEDYSETWDSFWTEPFLSEASLMLNDDFGAATEAVMYPTGLLSPTHSTGFFHGEPFCQFDDLFSSAVFEHAS